MINIETSMIHELAETATKYNIEIEVWESSDNGSRTQSITIRPLEGDDNHGNP